MPTRSTRTAAPARTSTRGCCGGWSGPRRGSTSSGTRSGRSRSSSTARGRATLARRRSRPAGTTSSFGLIGRGLRRASARRRPRGLGGRARGARLSREGALRWGACPSPEELGRFLRACRKSRVPFKATAGLHHPLAAEGRHGFLNVLAACAFEDDDALAGEVELDGGRRCAGADARRARRSSRASGASSSSPSAAAPSSSRSTSCRSSGSCDPGLRHVRAGRREASRLPLAARPWSISGRARSTSCCRRDATPGSA